MNAPPPPSYTLLLSEVLGAMSYALDLTEGQPPGHCLRCCWIGMHLGHALGFSEDELWDLYYTLLLKDAGCSSNAARLCALYGSDDRSVKSAFKKINSQDLFEVTGFVLKHAALGQGLKERFQTLLNLAQHGESLATELVVTRCERGAAIARQLGFSTRVAAAIHSLDEHWNGAGRPEGLRGSVIPAGARIALLAQVVDVFNTMGGSTAALEEAGQRSGSWFDPEIVRALKHVGAQPGFWEALRADGLAQRVQALEPQAHAVLVDEIRLDQIAEAFAQVVDSKSPYTYGHSARVARYAQAVAGALGLSPSRQQWLHRGALLHDLGKLGVSNSILDKPGSLTPQEWEAVRAHAGYTEDILSRITPFADLAKMAGAHHERLDGKGYPRGLTAEAISLETRIITLADIFDAITADRPYRAAIPLPQALEMMEKVRDLAIDGTCLDALKAELPGLAMHD